MADIPHVIYYAIAVHPRPSSPRKNRYDVVLAYEDQIGTHVIRRIAPVAPEIIHRKDEAISLFKGLHPGVPIRFIEVTSPYVVNKATKL